MATKKKEKAPEETKAVAKVAEMQAPVVQDDDGAWGSEGLDAGDILMPKILLGQGLSKAVTEGDVTQGQIYDSLSKKVLGGITNIKTKACDPVSIIAFSNFKTWLEFEKEGGEWVYKKTYPRTPENCNLPREELVNGIEVRRDERLNFYVLRSDAAEKGEAMPAVISFRRTSMKAGKKIATWAAEWKALGQKPLAYKQLTLKAVAMQKDDKTFWGFEVDQGAVSTPKQLAEAKKWYSALKTLSVRVDDSDLTGAQGDEPVNEGAPGMSY